MAAKTDTEIKQTGLHALVDALGEVDAERFIALLHREPFDYTTWQRTIYSNLTVEELSSLAMKARHNKAGH